MINQAWLTGIQALQLLGIGPCLLLLSFLLLALKEPLKSIAPLLFLLSLSAGFLSVLSPLLEWRYSSWQHDLITVTMEAFPACAFLLMIQFLRNQMPKPLYWLILLLPTLGSSALIYLANITNGEICVSSSGTITCLSNSDIHSIYMVITGGLTMLLMMTEIMRHRDNLAISASSIGRQRDQYWLIISLVVLTVILLMIELAQMMNHLERMQSIWVNTMTRLGFVFLMFASFFRIFGGQFAIDMSKVPTAQRLLSSQDTLIATQIEALLTEEKIYREMGMNRPQLADKLKVSESRLSHIINRYFGCNCNILLNQRRVREAQERLLNEPKTQVTVIAFEVGFNSIATFNRVFKEVTGMSPSEWRQGASER